METKRPNIRSYSPFRARRIEGRHGRRSDQLSITKNQPERDERGAAGWLIVGRVENPVFNAFNDSQPSGAGGETDAGFSSIDRRQPINNTPPLPQHAVVNG